MANISLFIDFESQPLAYQILNAKILFPLDFMLTT